MPSATADPLFIRYRRERCPEAFRGLVSRHVAMVYRTAERVLASRSMWAEDVAQAVFDRLARRAVALPEDISLGAWLHRQTVRLALNHARGEDRRAAREQTALELAAMNTPDPRWEALRPRLDEIIHQLRPADRQAVILRYLESRSLAEVGRELGISPEAAQKRVSRALDALRSRLGGSSASLALLLTNHAAQALPAELAGRITGTAVAAMTAAPPSFLTTTLVLMTQTHLILLGAAAGLLTSLFWPAQASAPPASAGKDAAPVFVPSEASAEPKKPASPEIAGQSRTAADIFEEMRGLLRQPDNELTRLRLRDLLGCLSSAELALLLTRSGSELEKWALQRLLPTLAQVWGDRDAPAAIAGLLSLKAGFPWPPNPWQLAESTFEAWHRRSPGEAQSWLVNHQDDPLFQKNLPAFITTVAGGLVSQGVAEVARWAGQLEGDDLQSAALSALWKPFLKGNGRGADSAKMGRLFQELQDLRRALPDNPDLAQAALRELGKAWNKADEKGWLKFLATLEPGPASYQTALTSGMERDDFRDKPAEMLETLTRLAPDLPPLQISRDVVAGAKSLPPDLWSTLRPHFLDAAGNLRDPADAATLLQAARLLLHKAEHWSTDTAPAFHALETARLLPDPAVRDPLIYGIYRQWLQDNEKKPEWTKDPRTFEGLKNWPAELRPILDRAERELHPATEVKP